MATPGSGEIIALLLPLDKDDFILPIPPETRVLGLYEVEGIHLWCIRPGHRGQTHFLLLRAGDRVPSGYEFVASTQTRRGAVKLLFRQSSSR
ncbi:MAG: hypothetical protein E6I70_07165 [Chloroflexi bacterium]|nr:MAG: hypothetical protein E6I70_07165 [Chloroflexota bacterium]